MIPLRDNIPTRRFPIVTLCIMAITTLVFFYELSLGSSVRQLFFNAGIVPKNFTLLASHPQLSLSILPTLFTYMFLHGGWWHIISNMWILWIFGDNIEDRLGRIRFLVFYVAMGVIAGLAHLLTNPQSTVPTVGASGAIAGVMGAYFILYPGARVLTLVPIFIFIQLIELPAFIFLGLWFLGQFFMGALGLVGGSQAASGIAWWAHIGGFVAGFFLIGRFIKNGPRPRYRRN